MKRAVPFPALARPQAPPVTARPVRRATSLHPELVIRPTLARTVLPRGWSRPSPDQSRQRHPPPFSRPKPRAYGDTACSDTSEVSISRIFAGSGAPPSGLYPANTQTSASASGWISSLATLSNSAKRSRSTKFGFEFPTGYAFAADSGRSCICRRSPERFVFAAKCFKVVENLSSNVSSYSATDACSCSLVSIVR